MKIEFLVLATNDDSFCNSKKAFIDFLKVDSLISISGKNLSYKKTLKSKPLITVKFDVETKNIPSNKERYFIIVLENTDENLVDEFFEVSNKIKELSKRINPGSTVINVLWDDIGRYYAHKSYPLINEVENVMRKLISKFMLINVGMNWSKETIHPDLVRKIERFEDDDTYINDLYKLDFINLSEVLFKKKRDITLDELDRLLLKTKFDNDDKDKIRKYLPKSNWEKYFSDILGKDSQHLEKKWELLYKLRNKVAHNRFLTREDFKKITGLTSEVKEILIKAMNKLDEIDLNEEDKTLILNDYYLENPINLSFLAEKAVAEYFIKNGYDVEIAGTNNFEDKSMIDLVIKKANEVIAVEIKFFSLKTSPFKIAHKLHLGIMQVHNYMLKTNIKQGKIICMFKGSMSEVFTNAFIDTLFEVKQTLETNSDTINLHVGIINERDEIEFFNV
ncbi:HEPN domain-containing protein [Proteus vulgaris]|uniref:HEPN domain-containing protein n=1 Tax=Proteus vulgaris TaxID=585 RepID=UPI0021B0C436|nr:HEPN domain-containing protein [Proteus vulgaris]MCT6515870.1 HEPN domain-containing protein [Proteus vulgaris]